MSLGSTYPHPGYRIRCVCAVSDVQVYEPSSIEWELLRTGAFVTCQRLGRLCVCTPLCPLPIQSLLASHCPVTFIILSVKQNVGLVLAAVKMFKINIIYSLLLYFFFFVTNI